MKERGNKKLRFWDKHLGIPLIWILGSVRYKKQFNPDLLNKKNLRIIILKIAGIGDTILLSSIVSEIKESLCCPNITFVCSKSNYDAVKGIASIDNIFVFDISTPINSLFSLNKLGQYDILLDFAPWARINSLMAYFIKAIIKVGFKTRDSYRHYIYDLVVEHRDNIHEVDNYRNIIKALGIAPKNICPFFRIDVEAFEKISTLLLNRYKYMIFHPFPGGAGKHLKEWPVENWIILGKELIERGYRIIITGGVEDAEQADYLANSIDNKFCMSLAGKLTLSETAALIKTVNLLISVNTGIMHLAATLGAKVIALHGPTSALRWGPMGQTSVIIKAKSECSPCLNLGFEYGCKNGGCMSAITVKEVLAKL
jgi:heptosyltransferase I